LSSEPRPSRLELDEPAPGVARLTIVNPDKRGALDHTILGAFADIVPGLDHRCLIVTGRDGMFSAGYDIADLPDDVLAREAEKLVAQPFAAALGALEDYAYPVVGALTGPAIGGGLEVALSCDLRVAAAGIKLGMPPAKLGLVYSHTGLQKFIETVGVARTRELFLTGRNIDAERAERWGLVNEVVPAAELEERALALAGEIAANAPLALSGNKRVIRALTAAHAALAPDVEREVLELRRACFSSDDFREGVRAFGDKRPPRWRGR
jgi:enoyl-CoA hydratase/carnithine racemase